MDPEKALELADKLIHAKLGKHLNDLEREVFLGSWQGKTYEQIYPLNPSYIEKSVGYKLWQKLSEALGEKVTKKKIHGALKRANGSFGLAQDDARTQKSCIAIARQSQTVNIHLAENLATAIAAAGYCVLTPPPFSVEDARDRLDSELARCDYSILLLSPEVALSEMVLEELRQIKELQASRLDRKPIILPIRVNCSADLLNHDLRSYLNGLRPLQWQSPVDTPVIIDKILSLLANPDEIRIWEEKEDGDAEKTTTPTGNSFNPPLHRDPTVAIEPPSPVAEPELPKGQVRLSSAFYIERVPYEQQCYQAIAQPGALIRLKAPRQMGKTSLMARVLDRARELGYRTVPLSFQHADRAVFANLNELLRWFCARIARKLRLQEQLDEYWTDTYGSKDNCTIFFEDCLLMTADTPLVLGLDEVDRVFDYPTIADDFFGLLRAWYEDAGRGDGDSELWEKLRLVVVHSTEVYIPMDINQSPFNVGLPIELSEFTFEQVMDLVQRHGLSWSPDRVKTLMGLVGGHPYLVRLALYHIIQQHLTLEELVEVAPTEAGIYGDHLRRHLWNLQKYPELAEAFKQVVMADSAVELPSALAFKLHSMGLVDLRGNEVAPRLELYRHYFRDRAFPLQGEDFGDFSS